MTADRPPDPSPASEPQPTPEADAAGAAGAPAPEDGGARTVSRLWIGPRAEEKLARHPDRLPGRTEDERFLRREPRPAFLDTDPWRVLRILGEFVDGFDALADLGPGGDDLRLARGSPRDRSEYELAGRSARKPRASTGSPIITGGGPGLMEAANRGCREGGRHVGRLQHRAAARAGAQPLRATCGSTSATSSSARRCS